MAPRIFPAIQTARKGFLKYGGKQIFFCPHRVIPPPSKTVTPAANVEGEEDGNCMLRHRNYEVEACDLGLNVPICWGPGVVLEIINIMIFDPSETIFEFDSLKSFL